MAKGYFAKPGEVQVARALLSVSDKTGIVEFARGLSELGIEIVSTGGTAQELEEAGIEVRSISDFTGFPEIMDGRVKTLHPKLYGGLLCRRDEPLHLQAADEQGIEFVDLVCVNLYPFERTSARRGVDDAEVVENIDIGGPSMIRAAAKNYEFAAAVVRPESYDAVLDELREDERRLSLATRESLAGEAFAYTARYDTAIARWFAEKQEGFPAFHVRAFEKVLDLPYGENPHQRAAYYAQVGARMHVLSMVKQHGGKDLSFNNLLDLNCGAAAGVRVPGPGLRDHQAQQPVWCGPRRVGARLLPPRLRGRPAERVRRGDLPQPRREPRARRSHRRSVRRAGLRARHSTRTRSRSCRASPTCGSSRTTSAAR